MRRIVSISGILLSQAGTFSQRVESALTNLDIQLHDFLERRDSGEDPFRKEMIISYFEIRGSFKFCYQCGYITRDEFRKLMKRLNGKTYEEKEMRR